MPSELARFFLGREGTWVLGDRAGRSCPPRPQGAERSRSGRPAARGTGRGALSPTRRGARAAPPLFCPYLKRAPRGVRRPFASPCNSTTSHSPLTLQKFPAQHAGARERPTRGARPRRPATVGHPGGNPPPTAARSRTCAGKTKTGPERHLLENDGRTSSDPRGTAPVELNLGKVPAASDRPQRLSRTRPAPRAPRQIASRRGTASSRNPETQRGVRGAVLWVAEFPAAVTTKSGGHEEAQE